jgi:signal transduction histidine kinase/CheY-like chemotaxis protein/HPt (histidine-containing phosphotransfer) domain-containing protein
MRATGLTGHLVALMALAVAPPLAVVLLHDLQSPLAGGGAGPWPLALALTVSAGLALALALGVLRRAGALARQRDRARRESAACAELLARVSHDVRNPLDGIIGYAALLDRTALDAQQREYLASVRRAARTLLDLVNEPLEFARSEQSAPPSGPVDFDLGGRVDETLELFAPAAHGKGLELCAYIAPDVPARVRGDPVRLAQALVNLVSNAVKFTAAGTVAIEVTRAVDARRGSLRIKVSDTGRGMSRAEQAQLTRPAGPGAGAQRPGGSGLGLVITRALVERMGGRLHLRSTRGTGTSVSLTVPLEAGPPLAEPADPDLAGRHALVIERNPESRRALCAVLRTWGLQVTELDDPARAGECLASDPPFDFALLGLAPGQSPEAAAHAALEAAGRLARYAPVVLAPMAGAPALGPARGAPPGVRVEKPLRRERLHQTLRGLMSGRLPSDGPGAATPPAPGAGGPALPTGTRILVAEDNPVSQQLVRTLLEGLGARVTVAANGREALARILGETFDLVLIDLNLPELGGAEVTARVRATEHDGRRTPIVALTADALDQVPGRGAAVDLDAWLTKPVDDRALLEVVRRWVGHPARAMPAGPLPPPRAPPVLDRTAALAAAGGQQGLADELLGMLIAELPGQQTRIARGLESGDLTAVGETAHSLAGSAAYCGATALERAARSLMQAARAADPQATATVALALEDEARRLTAEATACLGRHPADAAREPPAGREPG